MVLDPSQAALAKNILREEKYVENVMLDYLKLLKIVEKNNVEKVVI